MMGGAPARLALVLVLWVVVVHCEARKSAKARAEELHVQATEKAQQQQWAESENLYKQALKAFPGHIQARWYLALVYQRTGRHDLAAQQLQTALEYLPEQVAIDTACEIFDSLGVSYQHLKQYENAVAAHKRALEINPSFVSASFNLGVVLQKMKRNKEALDVYSNTIKLQPTHTASRVNRAALYVDQRSFAAAEEDLRRAMELDPNLVEAHWALGGVLEQTERTEEAMKEYATSVRLDKSYEGKLGAVYYMYQGMLERQARKYLPASEQLRKAVAMDPELVAAQFLLHDVDAFMCAWEFPKQPLQETLAQLERHVADGKLDNHTATSIMPFYGLMLNFSLPESVRLAGLLLDLPKAPVAKRPPVLPLNGRRLRVGFVSSDYYNHPVYQVLAGLLRDYDNSTVDFVLYDIHNIPRWDNKTATMRPWVADVVDLTSLSHEESAKRIRSDRIDILLDLNGITPNHRMGMYVHSPAPVTAIWAGCPGSTGNPFIDYVITDRRALPEPLARHYTETPVYLPNSWFTAHHAHVHQGILNRTFHDEARARLAANELKDIAELPEGTIVFGYFGIHWKIDLPTFMSWIQILLEVENSVLFLLATSTWANASLRVRFELTGVDPKRLFLVNHLTYGDNIVAASFVDLFLDTPAYAGGVTTIDLLWGGAPILTVDVPEGKMSQRSGVSLVHAMNMPELVAPNLDEYVTRAVRLAKHPEELLALRTKVQAARTTAPLFNTKQFAGDFVRAMHLVWQQAATGRVAVVDAEGLLPRPHDEL